MTRTEWMEMARDVGLDIVKAWRWGIRDAPLFWLPLFAWASSSGDALVVLTVAVTAPAMVGLAYERGRLDEIKRRTR